MPEKILIVDDDEGFLKMTKTVLEKAGYEVMVASDGEQGLIAVDKSLPGLILSDMLMPGMNGFTFCQKLKFQDKTKDIPIIVLSAKVQLEDSFRALGVDDFLPKPIDSELLQNKIRHHLKMSGAHANRPLKILAYCSQEVTAKRIRNLLAGEQRCSFAIVSDPADIFGQALRDYPDMIFVDVVTGEIPPDEIIKALRAISLFKQTIIDVYHPVLGETASVKVLSFQEVVDACLAAGADEDLGHFNEVIVRGCIQKYLSK